MGVAVSPSSTAAIGLLLYELERFPGVCILTANNIQVRGCLPCCDPPCSSLQILRSLGFFGLLSPVTFRIFFSFDWPHFV
jgi:hypothetical protein